MIFKTLVVCLLATILSSVARIGDTLNQISSKQQLVSISPLGDTNFYFSESGAVRIIVFLTILLVGVDFTGADIKMIYLKKCAVRKDSVFQLFNVGVDLSGSERQSNKNTMVEIGT